MLASAAAGLRISLYIGAKRIKVFMRIQLPEHVNQIIHRLQSEGYAAYAVGGCVRDSILGRVPQDWDITTSAHPQEVKALFSHTIDTGIRHGTVTVMLDRKGYEVTTYRIDGEYEDCRHPKEVIFTDNLLEDLQRRDFTINAMAYNEDAGLVDAFCGAADLKQGIIRCVGEPHDRFREDALRMLRAVRFAAQLGFAIDERTREAVRDLSGAIAKVSAERIQMELAKLLLSGHPDELRTACELGLTAVFLPELDRMMLTAQRNKHHCYSVGEHTLHTLREVPPDKVLRLTMLLHDVAKPVCISEDEKGQNHFHGHPEEGARLAREILRRLKLDNDTVDSVCRLIRYHDERPPLTERTVRRLASRIGPEWMEALAKVKKADVLGQSMYRRQEKLAYVDQLIGIYRSLAARQQCMKRSDLAINGRDLIAMGMQQGRELGDMLDTLFERVLDEPELNTREKLLVLAHNIQTSHI